jgi:hypothetical protein
MSTRHVSGDASTSTSEPARIVLKLEAVALLPVTDVARTKSLDGGLGSHLDADVTFGRALLGRPVHRRDRPPQNRPAARRRRQQTLP